MLYHVCPSTQSPLPILPFLLQVGGGPTGVELAAEMHDYIKEDLVHLFPSLKVPASVASTVVAAAAPAIAIAPVVAAAAVTAAAACCYSTCCFCCSCWSQTAWLAPIE